MSQKKVGKILDFILLIGKLKTTSRTGWVDHGIPEAESVADHMYRMSVMSFLINKDSNLDKDKCMKMAVVHDMAECIVGDITPRDGLSKEEKFRREKNAMEHITGLVDAESSQEITSLWQEYESQQTEEARLVKDLDMFDMIVQAYEYETMHNRPNDLQDFFNSTAGKFKSNLVQSWVEELYCRRKDFLSSTEKCSEKKVNN